VLPRDLEDAARLEGAGEWTIFWRVVVPQTRLVLAVVALLGFIEQWRSFLWPLVLTRVGAPEVLDVGMADLRGAYGLSGPDQIAVAALALVPVAVLCVVAHASFVRGIVLSLPTAEARIGTSAPR
jgi:multiple sugar transport system permease protein